MARPTGTLTALFIAATMLTVALPSAVAHHDS